MMVGIISLRVLCRWRRRVKCEDATSRRLMFPRSLHTPTTHIMRRELSCKLVPVPVNSVLRHVGVVADQPLLCELRRKSVHLHLVVLVVRPWPDCAFNHLTHGVERFAFPDADAQFVIVGSRMDW